MPSGMELSTRAAAKPVPSTILIFMLGFLEIYISPYLFNSSPCGKFGRPLSDFSYFVIQLLLCNTFEGFICYNSLHHFYQKGIYVVYLFYNTPI